MSILKTANDWYALRRARRVTTSSHFTKSERASRADTLYCAMNAPEADRRYATYFTTVR